MSSRYKGTPEEQLALNTYIKLMRSTRAVRWNLGRHLESYGLTLSQLGVLESLYHLGSMIENELRPKLFALGLEVDELFNRLERKALIRRERSPGERRLTIVYLTEVGKELVEEVFPRHVKHVADCFSVLTQAERAQLSELCKKLGLHAEA